MKYIILLRKKYVTVFCLVRSPIWLLGFAIQLLKLDYLLQCANEATLAIQLENQCPESSKMTRKKVVTAKQTVKKPVA